MAGKSKKPDVCPTLEEVERMRAALEENAAKTGRTRRVVALDLIDSLERQITIVMIAETLDYLVDSREIIDRINEKLNGGEWPRGHVPPTEERRKA